MTDTYQYLLEDTDKALGNENLLSAITSLKGAANCLQLAAEEEELEQMDNTYEMLLSYYIKGAEDPSRTKIHASLLRRCYELLNTLRRKGEIAHNETHYARTYTTLQTICCGEPSVTQLFADRISDHRTLFDTLLTSALLTQPEEEAIGAYLSNGDVLLEMQCTALSALTLSALKFFDIAKFHLLFNAAHSEECMIRVRAITGLVFVVYSHPECMDYYPEVFARLMLWMDEKGVAQELEDLQTQLFLSLDTKKLDQKLNGDLMPKIMKKIKDASKDLPANLQDLHDGLTDPELNPEWNSQGNEELEKMFKEFSELQQKGADLYMGSFKNLKQRFPFFNRAANWFIPFTYNHPEIPADSRKNPFLTITLRAGSLCDSDLYSLSLMAEFSPTLNIEAMRENMPKEMMAEIPLTEDGPDVPGRSASYKDAVRSYVQDFYRFCNLFTFRKDYPNPFTEDLFLGESEPFDYVFLGSSIVERLADFVFKDESYSLAHHLFFYIQSSERSALVWQKMGFCCEKLKDYDSAADYYAQALEKDPSGIWTKRRLAECLKRLGRNAEAELHLLELEQKNTEDVRVALLLAECFIEEELYEEAFKRLFKIEYLSPSNTQAKRAIAWCSLVTGKLEQAEKYYDRIASAPKGLSPADWLNVGHTRWLLGKTSEAVDAYCRALTPEADVSELLENDKDLLMKAGKSKEDLLMMVDAVAARKLNEK